MPALAGQVLTASDLICAKPRRYNLALFMLHCNIRLGRRRVREKHGTNLVPAARFQREFPAHVAVMRELRGARLAQTEGGEQPKLTIKAPSAICRTGRVYCVVIGPATG